MTKVKPTEKTVLWIVFVIFSLYAISLAFPFIWILINSFKSKREFFNFPIGLPREFIFSNYVTIFSRFQLGAMFANSLFLSMGSVACGLISSSLAAYVISKYEFKLRNIIYYVAITVMIIPTTGSLAALFRLMYDLKLINTYIGIFIMGLGGFGFNFFLLYGYFKSISWSYAEAAMVDGAGHFQIFAKIMLPQAKPALFALGIISFIGSWNDYTTPYMFLKGKVTLAVGIQKLSEDITYGANASDYPALFSAMIISTVPIITIFAIFQKIIIRNTVTGGLKG